MTVRPRVSIIIVNYNGRNLLDECLLAVYNLNFPKDQYEVIVVDNNSSDDSVPHIRAHFHWVSIVPLEENLGFTGGNNVGISKSHGEYIVLLNNDVVVDTNWLQALIDVADSHKKIGIVSSRLRYAMPFVMVNIQSQAIPRSQINSSIDHSPVGVLLEDVLCSDDSLTKLVYYQDGFYDKRTSEVTVRRTNGNARVMVPFPFKKGKNSNTYTYTLHGDERHSKDSIPVTLSYGRRKVETHVLPLGVRQLKLTIKTEDVKDNFVWLIQNAGNIVMHSGYCKDRGSLVDIRSDSMREFYEAESEYFMHGQELLAACGAGCLIKRQVFDHVGTLDGHYFMYYEDTEFSIRAWRAGWNIRYAPLALAYHKHRSTTGAEESSFFVELIERNRLAMVCIHFPLDVVVKELFLFSLRFFGTTMKFLVFQFRDDLDRSRIWRGRCEGRLAAFRFLLTSMPRLVISRIKTNHYWPINRRKMQNMLY